MINIEARYKPGTSMYHIIYDGWSRDFKHSQILEEVNAQGYACTIEMIADLCSLFQKQMDDYFDRQNEAIPGPDRLDPFDSIQERNELLTELSQIIREHEKW